ncbi:MAG: diaminopimelate epimerase [Bacteroidales bacterium]|jgi:diaminopimelate epimerase|nr:diaminopimelate epimerase [Bacteroidales bacterium]
MKFAKYQASGNDFVMLDNCSHLTEEQIKYLCDRHFGIGADGIVILQKTDPKVYDFEMKFYNPDGSTGMFCGNGGRCAVAFARDLGLIFDNCFFIAPDGEHKATIEDNNVILSMSNPSNLKQFKDGWFIDTGTQHFVKFVDNVDLIDVNKEGKIIRFDKRFVMYGGTNASFVQVTANHLKIRTYERGVEAETLSCGTAVTAAAVIHFIGNNMSGNEVVKVSTKGGILQVRICGEGSTISNTFLEGEAVRVFEGKIT